jgi:hypothetical protein
MPAYLYEVTLGVRLDMTLRSGELSSEAVLVDVDALALVAAIAATSGFR